MRSDTVEGIPSNRPHRWACRLGIIWWALTLVGCLALVRAPWLPWVTNSDGEMAVSINGFNALADDSLIPGFQLGAADTAQGGVQDDGTVPDLPSLSSIPQFSGGTDANAREGILVLVPGATALFIALWTLWGEIERRKSMVRIVFVLGGLSAIPLVRDLLRTVKEANGLGLTTVGIGIIIGLAGSVATMMGAGLLYWTIARQPQE